MRKARQTSARHGGTRSRIEPPGLLRVAEFFLALALLPAAAHAISPERTLAQLHHTSWTERDGAPDGALDVVQTNDGFLWLGARSGLFRFDGERFQRYESRAGDSIPATAIRCLLALPDNGLLIGWVFGGATLVRDGHALTYGEKDGLPPGSVYRFQIDGAGRLWAAASGGLARFDGKRWERIGAEWNFAARRAHTLFVDRDGTLAAFSDSTLMTLPKGATSFQATGVKLTGESEVAQSRDGTYFAADVSGIRPIASLNGYDRLDRPWNLEATKSNESQVQTHLLVDRDGGLWFGSTRGVGRVARPERREIEVEYFGRGDGLSSDLVLAIFEDRDGSIWIATSGGVDRFRSSRFTAQPATARDFYPALLPESDGAVRFAGTGHPLRELSPQGVVRPIATIVPTCAYRDADGTAWYGSWAPGGKTARLFREVDGRLQEVAIPEEISAGFGIQAVVVDGRRAPWISVIRQGVFRLADNAWSRPPELPDSGKRPAIVMTTDGPGGVWIGYTDNTVARWQDGAVRTWSQKDGLTVGNVLSILASDRRVWVAGESGLAVLEGTSVRPMRVSDAGVLHGLTGLVETEQGNLWLHGTAGAVLIEAGEVQKAIEHPGYAMAYRLFDNEDGLLGAPTYVSPLPTLVAGRDGRLWFGTVRGVFMLDPGQVVLNRVPPTVVIDAALAGEQLHRSPVELALPALTTNLRVDYTATSLAAPRHVHFRYQLEGVDPEWKDAGLRRQAFYTNLGPGHYRFHVSATNEDGIWNEQGASFAFTIAPTWYQSRWFYVLCAALLISALALLYRLRVAQVRAQTHSRLQVRLLERERIARELHDTLIQGFQGLILSFEAAMRRIPRGQAPRAQMEETLGRADQILAQGRERVRGLRESVVYQGDLRAALTDCATDLAALYPAACVIGVQGAERQLHPVALEEIYGIAREALTNAFRHSGTQRVEVEVIFGNDHLRIRIVDNGKGIDAEVLTKGGVSGHWGLPGMRERAKKLRAKLRVRSEPGTGTEVELEIPATVAYRSPHDDDSWWGRLRRRLRKGADDVE